MLTTGRRTTMGTGVFGRPFDAPRQFTEGVSQVPMGPPIMVPTMGAAPGGLAAGLGQAMERGNGNFGRMASALKRRMGR